MEALSEPDPYILCCWLNTGGASRRVISNKKLHVMYQITYLLSTNNFTTLRSVTLRSRSVRRRALSNGYILIREQQLCSNENPTYSKLNIQYRSSYLDPPKSTTPGATLLDTKQLNLFRNNSALDAGSMKLVPTGSHLYHRCVWNPNASVQSSKLWTQNIRLSARPRARTEENGEWTIGHNMVPCFHNILQ